MLELGCSYHVKQEFFELVNDKFLMSNKENGGYRPHFLAIRDKKNQELYWMVPVSSQFKKYQRIFNKKVTQHGNCDNIVLGLFAGNWCAFLIQNVFPITEKYIAHVHTIEGHPIRVNTTIERDIKEKVVKCLTLHAKGIKIIFTDVEKIKGILESSDFY